MEGKISPKRLRMMRERPYYAVLHAINCIGGRLPGKVEEFLGSDPEACLLYAKMVLKGRLPDNLHNQMVLGNWEGKEREMVKKYLEYLN